MMELMVVILIAVLAGIAFNLEARYELRRRRAEEFITRMEAAQYATDNLRTIDLIGKEAYHDMTERIDNILHRHGTQPCLSLNLTSGPDTAEGAEELHRLLPGYPVKLVLCSEAGVEWIDVYYNGARIGRLTLLESMTLRNIMIDNHLRGAYVAEQNCYGIEDSYDMRIIVFYEPINKNEERSFRLREIQNGATAHDFCQN